jgi:hypothetical protein
MDGEVFPGRISYFATTLQTVLRNYRIIRPLFAGFLLALFALAITPKSAIHALVAHHKDTRFSVQVGQCGFHCAIDNLVVEFPFLRYSLTVVLEPEPIYPEYSAAVLTRFIAAAHPLFGLRGPPALLFSAC